MPIIGSLFEEYSETTGQDPFTLQNKKMLKIQMGFGPVMAKTGSMVAYQGDVRFQNTGSGGLNKMLKSKMTGEGVDMMQCEGTGELFVADFASEIQVFYLDNDMVSVNGGNVLAFSSSIEWDIHRVNAGKASMMAGGLFNVSLRGTGYVAVTTKGDPVALDVAGAPTYADAQAVVLWTAGVSMDIRVDTGGLKSMLRGGTGELIQMAFGGQGYVLVQPSETVIEGGAQKQQSSGGGLMGNLMGG
ncbi:MAG: AIM24 family protein, partial [Microthrixaceae bacterium]